MHNNSEFFLVAYGLEAILVASGPFFDETMHRKLQINERNFN
jgi:hypothetical protein